MAVTDSIPAFDLAHHRSSVLTVTGAVVAAVLIALLLRLPFLSRTPFWYDELFSLYYASRDLAFMWGEGRLSETSPPLYYTLLSLWITAFGTAEGSLRLLSTLLSAAAIPFIYLAGANLGGRTAGALAALFAAVSAIQVDYALQARGYALLMPLTAVALWALSRSVKGIADGTVTTAGALARRAWPVVPACILAIYTHDVAVFIAMVLSLVFSILWLAHRPRHPAVLAAWIGLMLAVAAASLPQLLVMIDQREAVGIAYIPPPSAAWVYGVVRSLALGEFLPYGTNLNRAAMAFVAGLTLWSLWRLRRNGTALAIGALLPAAGLALLVGISLFRPILLVRTAIWITLPLYLLHGTAITSLRSRDAMLLSAAATLVFAAVTVVDVTHASRDPWPEAVALQTAQARPGDLFGSTDPLTVCAYEYYGGEAAPAARRRLVIPTPSSPQHEGELDLGCNQPARLRGTDAAAFLSGGGRLWLLVRRPEGRADLDALISALGDGIAVRRDVISPDITAVMLEAARPLAIRGG